MVATKRPALQRTYHVYKKPRFAQDVARVVRSLQESKYYNAAINHTAVTSTTACSAITAGSGTEERDGRKIMMTGLTAQIVLNTATSGFIRVIVYVPKVSSASLSLANVYSPVENDATWVLFDRMYKFDYETSLLQTINLKLSKKLVIDYEDGSGAAVRNPVKLYIHTSGTTTGLGWTKLWFKDM